MRKTNITKKQIEKNYNQYRCQEIEDLFERSQWIGVTQRLHNRHKGDFSSMKAEMYRYIEGHGTVRKIWNPKSGFRLASEHVKLTQGHNKGKLRPEHSEKMKITSAWNRKKPDRSERQKAHMEQLNTVGWKRRVLEGKGLAHLSNLSDLEINRMYSEFRKKVVKSPEYMLNCIRGFLELPKYSGRYDKDSINILYQRAKKGDTKSLYTLYRLRNSIKSTLAMETQSSMGSYKAVRTEISREALKYYVGAKQVLNLRSSWELALVDFLEGAHIPWEYESVTFRMGDMHYTPDFRIDLNQQKYFLEVKGVVYSDEQVEKQQNKFKKVYAGSNFIFLDTVKNLSIEYLLQNINMIVYKKTHEQQEVAKGPESYLGKSRDFILQTVEKGVVFVNDGWYIHVMKDAYIESWIITANRCKSYIRADYESKVLEHVTDSNTIGAIHLDWLEKQREELYEVYKLKKIA